jgi:hydroxymethylpyrimidine pyrophosphatase-like HAD family hydrolase
MLEGQEVMAPVREWLVVDSEEKAFGLGERLREMSITLMGCDVDGSLHDSDCGLEIPFEQLTSLKRRGKLVVLVTGSSPVTLGRKMLKDGADEAGVSTFGDFTSAVFVNDGSVRLKPGTSLDNVEAKSILSEEVIEEADLKVVSDALIEFMKVHASNVRWIGFHPTVKTGEDVYGYRFYVQDEQQLIQLKETYGEGAVYYDDLDDFLQDMEQGAVKVVVRAEEEEVLGEWFKKRVLPGSMSGLQWQPGGDSRVVLVREGVNKFAIIEGVGREQWGDAFTWDQVMFIGNDANDEPALGRAKVALIVNTRPEVAEQMVKRLVSRRKGGLLVMVDPNYLPAVLSRFRGGLS